MNAFMFSSFLCSHKVKKIMKTLPHDSIAYIPAHYLGQKEFTPTGLYYELGFRRGMNFPLGVNYNEKMERMLFSCDAIHLGGGNTFELLFMLSVRGLLPKLKSYVESGGVLFGTSAGSIVMCPDISIASFADSNWLNLEGEQLSSLGLVDFYMKPHWEMWSSEKARFKDFSKKSGKKIVCLRENQGIYISDDGIEFLGCPPKIIYPH